MRCALSGIAPFFPFYFFTASLNCLLLFIEIKVLFKVELSFLLQRPFGYGIEQFLTTAFGDDVVAFIFS